MNTQHITEGQFNRFIKSAEAVKDVVSIMDVAPWYVDLRRQGGNYVALCPLHSERTPSFTVYADTGRYYCYGCKETGDVINLHHRCGNFGTLWDAMVSLAEEFGVKLPIRSQRWHRWADDKGRVRKTVRNYIAQVYQRRLTRLYSPLVLVGGENPEEELEELDGLASALWPISLDLADRRVNGE